MLTRTVLPDRWPRRLAGLDRRPARNRQQGPTLDLAGDEERDSLLVIAVAFLIRSTICQLGNFGVDEAYTVVQARRLAWSYFDHPPLHYWITHVAVPVVGETRFARLPFIALFAVTSWLLFRLTLRLYGARAAFWAVAALNLAGFFTVSAGTWIVPDGPLLFGLALAALGVAQVLFPAAGEVAAPWRSWLLAGFGFGLAALSKYHAIIVAAGLVALLLTPAYRRHLAHPAPWLGGLLAMAMASPILVWNLSHGWASLAFQLGRGEPGGFYPAHLLSTVVGQIALLTPWIAAAIGFAAGGALRASRSDPADRFCAALALPTIVLFALSSLFGHIAMPHWSMPGWFFLLPLTGNFLAALALRWPKTMPTLAMATAAASTVLLVLLGAQVSSGLFSGLMPPAWRDRDPTLEAFAWSELAREATRIWPLSSNMMIVTDNWIDAGKLGLAFQGSVPVLPTSRDPRGFAFTISQTDMNGRDALVIVPKDKIEAAHDLIDPHFAQVDLDHAMTLWRGASSKVDFVLYRATGFRSPFAWPYGIDR